MSDNLPRHKVFISYYHADDQEYKDRLAQALDSTFVDKSVSQGDVGRMPPTRRDSPDHS